MSTQAESNASVIRLVLCAEQSEPNTGAALRHRLFTYHISHLNIQIWIPNYYRCSIFHLVSEPLHSEVRTVTWKVSVALSSLPQRFGSSCSSGFLGSLDPSVKHELVPTRNDELNDTTREAFFFLSKLERPWMWNQRSKRSRWNVTTAADLLCLSIEECLMKLNKVFLTPSRTHISHSQFPRPGK